MEEDDCHSRRPLFLVFQTTTMKESLCAHWSAAIILQRWSTEESSVKIHTMKLYRSIAYFLILLSVTTILAQEAVCGAVVQKALEAVGQSCAAVSYTHLRAH